MTMLKLLEIILGLFVVYLVFAIVVSRIQEWVAKRRSLRGKLLKSGICRLVGDPDLYNRVLQHPLVGSLSKDGLIGKRPPAYVDPKTFAAALANILVRRANLSGAAADSGESQAGSRLSRPLTIESLRKALSDLAAQRAPIASALLPIVDRAGGDIDTALEGIEEWFSSGMERVSGWYKASAQRSLLIIGFVVAALVNVDTFEIYSALNRSPELRGQLAQLGTDIDRDGNLGGVDLRPLKDRAPNDSEWKAILNTSLGSASAVKNQGLPLGYDCIRAAGTGTGIGTEKNTAGPGASAWALCRAELSHRFDTLTPDAVLLKVLGWFLTAFAGSLGAAYWFAAISKVINIRSTGPKPASVPAARG